MILVCLLLGGATVFAATLFVTLPSVHENSCYRSSTLLIVIAHVLVKKELLWSIALSQTCRKFTMVVVILGLFVLRCRKKLTFCVVRSFAQGIIQISSAFSMTKHYYY